MNKKKIKSIQVVCCLLVCISSLCLFQINAQAQTVDTEISEATGEYVTARVVINDTSRALGDPNASVSGDGVRLRSGPSIDYTILEVMYNGEYVSINFTKSFTESNGSWFYVKRIKTGTWGWVKSDFIAYWD